MQGTAVDQGQVGTTFAGAQVQFDLITHGADQYLAFFNVERNLVIKHRTLGEVDGPWSTRIIQESSYNPEGGRNHSYKKAWDSHNWVRLGVDASGRLHVEADMHKAPMRYWRMTTARDVSSLTRIPFLTTNEARESSVTYPEFIDDTSGNLGWLIFRNGASGDGDTHVYRWKNATREWEQVSRPMAGMPNDASAYWEVFPTSDGWFHIVFNWRETGDADSNTKLSYLKTQDFVTYKNAAGATVPVPVKQTHTSAIIDTIPIRKDSGGAYLPNGFVNSEFQFAKVGATTFVAYAKYDADDVRQIFLARSVGTQWVTAQVTDETGIGGLGNGFIENRMSVIDSNTLAIDYSLGNTGPRRRLEVPVATWNQGPFPSTVAPRYFPAEVYQTVDSFPGCVARTKADSRCHEQTGYVDRGLLASRPYLGRLYVISWLAGADQFAAPDPLPDTDTWPARPLRMYRITY